MFKKTVFLVCLTAVSAIYAGAKAPAVAETIKLPEPVGETGTIKCTLKINEDMVNGYNAKNRNFPLFKLGPLASARIRTNGSLTGIFWKWHVKWPKGRDDIPGMGLMLPELEAGKDYHLLYTWNTEDGLFDCYFNGWPVRIPGSKFTPWNVKTANDLTIFKGPFTISGIKCEETYSSPEKVARTETKTGANPFGSDKALFSQEQIAAMRGNVIYSNAGQMQPFKEWKKEGPVAMSFANGWTKVWSKEEKGHIVWWCPEELPDSFIAQWDIRILDKHGLCIVFFAAKAADGKDIFDPALKKRTGIFKQYIYGDITSYHISYFTNTPFNPGRPQTNMRKNNKFFLVSQGACGIPPESEKVHKAMLVKVKNKINMFIDGKSVISWIDPGTARYGKAWTDGYIGLRQMKWTVAEYRNFKAWTVKQ